jgi:hypothetical protein
MQNVAGWWSVWHGSGSMEYSEPPADAKRFPSEREASEFAHAEHTRIELVEYGIQHITKEEQMIALSYEIQNLSERLTRLATTGCQWKTYAEDDE